MKKSTKKKAPKKAPAKKAAKKALPPPPAKKEKKAPLPPPVSLEDSGLDRLVKGKIDLYCLEYLDLLEQEATLKQQKAALMAKLTDIATDAEIKDRIGTAEWIFGFTPGYDKFSLDKTKLLSNGVSLAVIEKCTKKTPVKGGYRVYRAGEKAASESDE